MWANIFFLLWTYKKVFEKLPFDFYTFYHSRSQHLNALWTVYIAKTCSLFWWQHFFLNLFIYNNFLPIFRSRVRIPHGLLFSWIVAQFKKLIFPQNCIFLSFSSWTCYKCYTDIEIHIFKYFYIFIPKVVQCLFDLRLLALLISQFSPNMNIGRNAGGKSKYSTIN